MAAFQDSELNEAAYILDSGDACCTASDAKVYEDDCAASEDSGFDIAWTQDHGPDINFGATLLHELKFKGYCVIQTRTSTENQESARNVAHQLTRWMLPKEELETTYLGRENTTKYAMLPDIASDFEPAHALSGYDRILTELAEIIEPLAFDYLGFNLWGRMNGMVRIPYAENLEKKHLRPYTSDGEDQTLLIGHLNFLERRRLLMMSMIDCQSGVLELIPFRNSENRIRLSIVSGRIVVIRTDLFEYAYKPKGDNLLLQAWLLSEPLVPDLEDKRTVCLPVQLSSEKVQVRSLAGRFPGRCFGVSDYWNTILAGSDALVEIPVLRFDVDLYYSPDKEEGFMYARHAGLCDESVVQTFANDHFGISTEETHYMSPSQRMCMEVGYENLAQFGFSMPTMIGRECGVFLGESGESFGDMDKFGTAAGQYGYLGNSNCITGSRLSHAFGLKGPCSVVDTACSSSLVALGSAHVLLRRPTPDQIQISEKAQLTTALVLGLNVIMTPNKFVLYSGPRMLSPRGRCFTFDGSADGYARGEGCGGVLLHVSDNDDENMFACLAASSINQDGRSANMTAPSGPAQQAVIRASRAEAGFQGNEVSIAECHGTGTALGDPIEIGALRSAIPRDDPLPLTSAKSCVGHLESAAGMAGLTKCILMLLTACAPPNVHLRCINSYLDLADYPALIENEPTDLGASTGFTGVSSFGFGGTNGRCDLWGRCTGGPRETLQMDTGKQLEVRLSLYKRALNCGTPGPKEDDNLFITGSWNAWGSLTKMTKTSLGHYTALVCLGETRSEQFKIVVNKDPEQIIHPIGFNQQMDAKIAGPDSEGKEASWLIRGTRGGCDTYRINLMWSFAWECGTSIRLEWVLEELPRLSAPIYNRTVAHFYTVIGTWTSHRYARMIPSQDVEGLWTTSVRLASSGREEFQIARDGDWTQSIYPASAKVDDPTIPIRGPDHCGSGRNWLLRGLPGELVSIKFQALRGSIELAVKSQSHGDRIWSNIARE